MTSVHTVTRKRQRKALVGAMVGHGIEWYDYGIYSFLAVFVGQLFFPEADPAVQLVSSFAVFALSFFARPLGALIFGPIADKVGRKPALTMVIILMSGATFALGLLPTYAQVGILAPILLVVVRVLQGIAAGGEVGTAVSFIAEYTGRGRRGFGTSFIMVIAVLGIVVGGVFANTLTSVLGAETMLDWGWRVPFLLAGPFGMIALYIRLQLEDTPEFQELERRGHVPASPLRETLQWIRPMLLITGFISLHASIFYLVLTFSSTYLSEFLGFDPDTRLWMVMLTGVVGAAVMPFGGMFTDRYGRRPFLLVVALLSSGAMLWFFLAAPGATPGSFLAPMIAVGICFGLYVSSTFAYTTELVPPQVRTTVIGIAFNTTAAVFGGTAPMIAAWIITSSDDISLPWVYFVGTGALSIIALLCARNSDIERATAAAEAATGSPASRADSPVETVPS